MFNFPRVDALPYLRCEWKSGPYDSVHIMTLLISDDMIVVEIVCLWKVVVFYCGGCVLTGICDTPSTRREDLVRGCLLNPSCLV
jgi:hypothetical protein